MEEFKEVDISWEEDGTVRIRSIEGNVSLEEAAKLSSAVVDWLEYDEIDGLKIA